MLRLCKKKYNNVHLRSNAIKWVRGLNPCIFFVRDCVRSPPEILVTYISHNFICKFPLTPMGALTSGSAHARPSAQPPIDTSGYFSGREGGQQFV